VKSGDRVALLAGNGPAFVQAVWGIGRAGAVLVPLNTRLTSGELTWQLTDCGTSLVIADGANHAAATAAGAGIPVISLEELAVAGAEQDPNSNPGPLDLGRLHSIIYTSGTTGRPKAAMLSYGNHFWSAIGSALHMGLDRNDRWLACMPLFHIG